MYSLEALCLNASQLSCLNNLLYSALAKVFKTFDNASLDWCLYYFNFWPLKFEYINRKIRFLLKLQNSENSLCKTWFTTRGKNELNELVARIGATRLNNSQIKNAVWLNFFNTLI